jgi:hypothetical protein
MRGAWSGTGFCTVSSPDILQLALLADATDASLVMVRSMDREQLNLATLHATVAKLCGACGFPLQSGRALGSGEQLHTTLFDIVVNSEHWLGRLLLRAEGSIRVVSPPEFATLQARTAESVLARYRANSSAT